MLIALLVPLGLAILVFTGILLKAAFAQKAAPNLEAIGLGAITIFSTRSGLARSRRPWPGSNSVIWSPTG